MKKLDYLLLFFISTLILTPSAHANHNFPPGTTTPPGYRVKTIVIDPGHGGHDGATKGKFSREKDVALEVSLKLGKAIEKEFKDVKVIFTRESDVFVKLYERTAVANDNKADLFISIHCNSMPITRKGQNFGSTRYRNFCIWLSPFGPTRRCCT